MSRIRADRVVNKTATDGPEFPLGATLPSTGTLSGPGGVNITGVITATKFVGDGSGLINLASQQQNTGVVVRDDNNLIGTAQTINFGTNANVTPIAGGICTVTSVNTDTNTEYTYQALPNGANVLLRLTDTLAAFDDINIVAGTNVVFDQVTTGGFRINNSAIAGITSVFIDPSPRLGGTLDLNGKAILGATSVNVTGTIKATNFEGDLTGNVTGSVAFAGGLSGTPDINVRNIVAAAATFSGDVSIGGTLTYEDVQNVDSVGIVTAGKGLRVTEGGVIVSTGGLTVLDGFSALGGDGSNSGVVVTDGSIAIKNNTGTTPSYIDFYCEVSNSHKVTIKAPPHADYSGNVTFQLPPNNGALGDLLSVDGSGNTSWKTVTTGRFAPSTGLGIHTTSSVGIGTTNPLSTLQVENVGVDGNDGTWTAAAGVAQVIDTWSISASDYRIAEYSVYIQNPGSANTGETQVQKILVTQDGTTANYEEYAIMSLPNKLVSLSADISSGNCRLIATPETGVSGITTYKFIRTSIL
ncbi:MAG: hypothetical protein CMO44_09580 [Verrucomicrobiales bacterium]|nr:hypothetical protein [Verrucomicrobiales bacterium]